MAHRAAYREAHPLYTVISHWINLVCMLTLIFSGFYIHYPFYPGAMSVMRGLHVAMGFIILINCIVRIIASFFIKTAQLEGTREVDAEIKNWVPQKINRHQLIPMVKYYLFAKKAHPIVNKFNPMQKISYVLIPFLILFMGYTGLCLWAPTQTMGVFQAGIELFGGLPGVRVLHYIFMWVFIAFMIIHVYLAIAEDSALVGLMFLWREHEGYVSDPKTGEIVGYDDLSDKAPKTAAGESN